MYCWVNNTEWNSHSSILFKFETFHLTNMCDNCRYKIFSSHSSHTQHIVKNKTYNTYFIMIYN